MLLRSPAGGIGKPVKRIVSLFIILGYVWDNGLAASLSELTTKSSIVPSRAPGGAIGSEALIARDVTAAFERRSLGDIPLHRKISNLFSEAIKTESSRRRFLAWVGGFMGLAKPSDSFAQSPAMSISVSPQTLIEGLGWLAVGGVAIAALFSWRRLRFRAGHALTAISHGEKKSYRLIIFHKILALLQREQPRTYKIALILFPFLHNLSIWNLARTGSGVQIVFGKNRYPIAAIQGTTLAQVEKALLELYAIRLPKDYIVTVNDGKWVSGRLFAPGEELEIYTRSDWDLLDPESFRATATFAAKRPANQIPAGVKLSPVAMLPSNVDDEESIYVAAMGAVKQIFAQLTDLITSNPGQFRDQAVIVPITGPFGERSPAERINSFQQSIVDIITRQKDTSRFLLSDTNSPDLPGFEESRKHLIYDYSIVARSETIYFVFRLHVSGTSKEGGVGPASSPKVPPPPQDRKGPPKAKLFKSRTASNERGPIQEVQRSQIFRASPQPTAALYVALAEEVPHLRPFFRYYSERKIEERVFGFVAPDDRSSPAPGALHPEVSWSRSIREAIARVSPLIDESKLTLIGRQKIAAWPLTAIQAGALTFILVELLSNAIKASPGGEVQITTYEQADLLEIRLLGSGPQFPEAEMARLNELLGGPGMGPEELVARADKEPGAGQSITGFGLLLTAHSLRNYFPGATATLKNENAGVVTTLQFPRPAIPPNPGTGSPPLKEDHTTSPINPVHKQPVEAPKEAPLNPHVSVIQGSYFDLAKAVLPLIDRENSKMKSLDLNSSKWTQTFDTWEKLRYIRQRLKRDGRLKGKKLLAAFVARDATDQILGVLILDAPKLHRRVGVTGVEGVDAVSSDYHRRGVGSALRLAAFRWLGSQMEEGYTRFVAKISHNPPSEENLKALIERYGLQAIRRQRKPGVVDYAIYIPPGANFANIPVPRAPSQDDSKMTVFLNEANGLDLLRLLAPDSRPDKYEAFRRTVDVILAHRRGGAFLGLNDFRERVRLKDYSRFLVLARGGRGAITPPQLREAAYEWLMKDSTPEELAALVADLSFGKIGNGLAQRLTASRKRLYITADGTAGTSRDLFALNKAFRLGAGNWLRLIDAVYDHLRARQAAANLMPSLGGQLPIVTETLAIKDKQPDKPVKKRAVLPKRTRKSRGFFPVDLALFLSGGLSIGTGLLPILLARSANRSMVYIAVGELIGAAIVTVSVGGRLDRSISEFAQRIAAYWRNKLMKSTSRQDTDARGRKIFDRSMRLSA